MRPGLLGRQMAEICFQKTPGQDLAKNGRFPMIPEEEFKSRPWGRRMAEIYFQKVPGQDLFKNGRFPMIPEEKFNCRPRDRQMAWLFFDAWLRVRMAPASLWMLPAVYAIL